MANQSNLIATAARKGSAKASTWRAYRDGSTVTVWHYSHPMVAVDTATGQATPLSRGYGSMTDKCGIRKILTGYGIPMGYRELHGD